VPSGGRGTRAPALTRVVDAMSLSECEARRLERAGAALRAQKEKTGAYSRQPPTEGRDLGRVFTTIRT
jgi:hypothetical protein